MIPILEKEPQQGEAVCSRPHSAYEGCYWYLSDTVNIVFLK